MDAERLNTALYEKMCDEQRRYREWLLSLPPEEILNHAYEYSIREDIVICVEEHPLSRRQAMALLISSCPLADIYKDWQNQETDHMEYIHETVITRAFDVLRAMKEGRTA